jgi:hypothetical protein
LKSEIRQRRKELVSWEIKGESNPKYCNKQTDENKAKVPGRLNKPMNIQFEKNRERG